LTQDANEAMDRLAVPYARFVTRHRLAMYAAYAAAIALVWMFQSKTLALVLIALVIAALVWAVTVTMWQLLQERRRSH
jgi:hypothetical protein